MSLVYPILGLLAGGPQHGYAIDRRLNALLHGVSPVNRGQVYATLARLARDGLVERSRADDATTAREGVARRAHDDVRRRRYQLTAAGRQQLRRWIERPVGVVAPRDALAERLALHVATTHDASALAALVARHRARCATLQRLLDATSPARDGAAARPDASGAPRASRPSDAAELVRQAAVRHLAVERAWMARIEEQIGRAACGVAGRGVLD